MLTISIHHNLVFSLIHLILGLLYLSQFCFTLILKIIASGFGSIHHNYVAIQFAFFLIHHSFHHSFYINHIGLCMSYTLDIKFYHVKYQNELWSNHTIILLGLRRPVITYEHKCNMQIKLIMI